MSAGPIKVAERWLEERNLASDLGGRNVRLVTFASDEDCAFFYPRRVALFHLKVNKELAPAIRKKNGKVLREPLAPQDYRAWLGSQEDTPERRFAFAESWQGVLREAGHSGS